MHTSYYEQAYKNLKEKEPNKFYPHIHKLMNYEDDINEAFAKTKSKATKHIMELFVRLLIFNNMADFLEQGDFRNLLGSVFVSEGGIGPFAPKYSPMLIENKENMVQCYLAERINVTQNGKIKIIKDDLKSIYIGNGSYKECFSKIVDKKEDVEYLLNSFESAFKAQSNDSFNVIVKRAAERLDENIKSIYEEVEDDFYAELHNLVPDGRDRILKMCLSA